MLSSSALSIRGHTVGSLTSRIFYTVSETDGGVFGRITVDAQPILGSSVAINSNSALQWDLYRDNTGWMRLASDAIRTSVDATSVSNQLSQPKLLWALLSTGEYGGGSFLLRASETASNSHVDSTGQYSFADSKNW